MCAMRPSSSVSARYPRNAPSFTFTICISTFTLSQTLASPVFPFFRRFQLRFAHSPLTTFISTFSMLSWLFRLFNMAPSLTYGSQNSSRLQSRHEEEPQRSRIFPHFHLPPIGLELIRARTRIIGNSSPKPSSSPDSSDWEHRPLEKKSSNMAKTRNSSTSASTPKKPKVNISFTKRPASRNSKDKRPSKTRKTAVDDTPSSASTKIVVIKEEEEEEEKQDDEVITKTWTRPVSISSEDDGSKQLAATTTQKMKALKRELEALKQQHNAELTQLKAELETSRTQTSTAQTACEGERETARTLREQLEATKSNLADARESITKLEETNDLLEKENEKLKAQITTLNTELSSEQEKNKSLLPRRSSQPQNPSSKPTLNTTTTTKMDSQRSSFPTPLSPSPAITISSTCSGGLNGDAETEKRMKTLQRNYMSLKTDYDILSYWAAQISDTWKSMDHSVFGTFGHSVKELRAVLEKSENNKRKVRGEGALHAD